MAEHKSDVVVIGGGMVGAAAALGLAQAGFTVTVVENRTPRPFDASQPPDLRISAISASSVALLESLGVWKTVRHMRSAAYRGLETWEWEASRVSFSAQELGIPELGYMLENEVLQFALWQHLEQMPNISLMVPAELKTIVPGQDVWNVELSDGREIETKLVLGADGANSLVRAQAGIGVRGWQYRQSCMLITVQTLEDPLDVTWQQFTPQGPRAFLPLWDNWASLVWYDSPARIRQLMALPMSQLTQEIKQTFPARLGDVTAIAAGSFPLVRRHANRYVQSGLALLGDAAHTINPLAGQGVNLGYRDVDALLDVVINARQQGEIWHSEEILKRYQHRRRPDNLLMQAGMDLFYSAFSNELKPLQLVRNLGLMAAQRSGELKKRALKYALGL